MKLLFLSCSGKSTLKDLPYIPCIGHKIDLFYHPYPTVVNVLLAPTLETVKGLGLTVHIDAIVTVK